ncbi:hypothetical protein NFI95_00375 [Acetobacteraceae bacterium KSS8]|uniref:Uncharacterized protein n=1 Tax=Endosaccharibacter trunci TaxID=2812733 RepID=A0ABT1W207_9PROT|nr:hypothetical protein [Acetobacteraceae bacterium KSS8]
MGRDAAGGTASPAGAWTLSRKLWAEFAAMVLVTMGLGFFSLYRLGLVNAVVYQVRDNYLPSAMDTGQLRVAVGALRESELSEVSHAAQHNGAAAAQVPSSAGELSQQAEILNREVAQFLRQVKAA